MRVSHAILHAFDFESGTSYPSDRELDLGSRPVKSYVQRHMRKIASSAESRHGTFAEDSSFGAGLAEYFAGRVGFVELSQQLAQFMWEQLRMCDDLVECDLLVCDFTDTKDMRARAAVLADGVVAAAVSDDPAAVGSEDLSQRLFGMAVLPRRQAFVHDLGNDATGAAANDRRSIPTCWSTWPQLPSTFVTNHARLAVGRSRSSRSACCNAAHRHPAGSSSKRSRTSWRASPRSMA